MKPGSLFTIFIQDESIERIDVPDADGIATGIEKEIEIVRP